MKRVALLALLFLVLAPSSTPSKPPSDNLIVPGQRIGPWSLEMNVDQFARTVGKSRDPRHRIEADWIAPLQDHCVTEICAFYRVKDELVYLSVSHISKLSTTGKGIGVGSPLSDVLAAYGRPTAMTRLGDDFGGFIRAIYDDIGVAFRVNFVTETVVSISVFRPGTARSIWQFQAN